MSDANGPDIALIGMAGRFPGAADLSAFWANLRAGRSAIRRLSPEELKALEVNERLRGDARFVPVAAPLEGKELFDAAFFGLSPREAEEMDPQQRLFLEVAWAALESAGIDPRRAPRPAGVFAGATTSNYLLLNLMSRPESHGAGALQVFVNNINDSLATRVSYLLDLTGPSFAVQSACSSSLVAVHLACQSLLNQECDVALAGGVSINLAQGAGYVAVDGSILATDGVCRPFDAKASGTVFGSGLGVVVLRRLADAVKDGDPIRAVIRGTAIGNDGHLKVGFTAPAVNGQAAVVSEALAVAGVRPDELDYIEAHGTGTALGDPVEVEALKKALGRPSGRRGTIALGSVKGAVGHLDVAAGIAGLLKTVLALEHEELPPSVGFDTPNPRIDFASSPVHVNATLRPWPRGTRRRLAGVSSFGFGGTNAHVVLEEAPRREVTAAPAGPQLLVLSARTPRALEAAATKLAAHLERTPVGLREVAWTLQAGRHPFRFRRAVVAENPRAAATALARPQAPVEAQETGLKVAFLFSGERRTGAGARLYRAEPAFREAFDACARAHAKAGGGELSTAAFAPSPAPALGDVALFAVSYATARWWMARGVTPALLMGSGVGEYVAACLAGVLSLDDAVALTAARAHFVESVGASPAAEALVERFRGRLRSAVLSAPRIPIVSTLTGRAMSAEEATSADSWVAHLTRPARVAEGLEALKASGAMVVEVGATSESARRIDARTVGGFEPGEGEVASLLGALGEAWCLGATPDWSTLHAGPPQRVPLPTYDFEPEPHWVARRPAAEAGAPHHPEALAPAFTGCLDARGPLEREVAAAWHEIMGLERLSVHDNFFQLGGDSLMATRLVSRLRERLGVELPLQELLEKPTIEGMACLVVSTLALATPAAELEALVAQAAAASPDELAALEHLQS